MFLAPSTQLRYNGSLAGANATTAGLGIGVALGRSGIFRTALAAQGSEARCFAIAPVRVAQVLHAQRGQQYDVSGPRLILDLLQDAIQVGRAVDAAGPQQVDDAATPALFNV